MCFKSKFSVELQHTVASLKAFNGISSYTKFENVSAKHFTLPKDAKNMREGHLKQSYIYFLIDPRISGNFPNSVRKSGQKKTRVWRQFLDSIFYVGKAKSARPHSHLYKAMKLCKKHLRDKEIFVENNLTDPRMRKLCRIIDIWQNGLGVVSLEAFHNIVPSEAYTREAAIIDALSLNHLTNQKCGVYYGPAREWSDRGKRLFGIALLYRAMHIFLAEGETQIFPADLV